MKKNIGIVFPSAKNGGVFQLALSIAESLINFAPDYEYFLVHYASENPISFLNINGKTIGSIAIPDKKFSKIKKISHFLGLVFGWDFLLIKDFYEIFKKNKIDLLIYPTPSTFDFFPYKIPFLASIPNLMHHYYPDFPEFGFRQNITRDIVYKYYAKNSRLNIVDAGQGAKDLLKFLGIQKEKSRIIPYIPAGYIYKYKNINQEEIENTLFKYSLPEKFIFYPAQFWFHKNHLRLIEAVYLVKKRYNVKINLVLTGTKKGNFEKIFSLIEKYGISDQIFHLGYVSEKEIAALYKKSVALVFPSLFGPTDIPCLEAMVLGAPIVCSSLFAIPEQVKNAAILFDPFKTEDIAEKIYKIWADENLCQELVKNGQKIAQLITLENYAQNWLKVIKEIL
jgi:glycosyltransferase involved in cell wall biosynthesis